ncbi:unnamed protein product [Closterium sp. Naga37s-1]|nr:unnamed protein product [Closterium sp. Naga37s-1]
MEASVTPAWKAQARTHATAISTASTANSSLAASAYVSSAVPKAHHHHSQRRGAGFLCPRSRIVYMRAPFTRPHRRHVPSVLVPSRSGRRGRGDGLKCDVLVPGCPSPGELSEGEGENSRGPDGLRWRRGQRGSARSENLAVEQQAEEKPDNWDFVGSSGDSSGSGDEGSNPHKFTFSAENSVMVDQVRMLQHIHSCAHAEEELAGGDARGIMRATAGGMKPRVLKASTPIRDIYKSEGPIDEDVVCMQADWPLTWTHITLATGVSVGSGIAGPEDVTMLTQATTCTAILCLQGEESLESFGVNWKAVQEQAEQCDVAMFRVPVPEFDQQKQVAGMVEAVRLLASLLVTGHRVHVACATGKNCSPLVVLGYLTFFQGLAWSEAKAMIVDSVPSADPSHEAWEQARLVLSAADGVGAHRMTELAEEQYQRRIEQGAGAEGGGQTARDDWEEAQRRLITETLQHRVSADVTISQSLSKAASRQASSPKPREVQPSFPPVVDSQMAPPLETPFQQQPHILDSVYSFVNDHHSHAWPLAAPPPADTPPALEEGVLGEGVLEGEGVLGEVSSGVEERIALLEQKHLAAMAAARSATEQVRFYFQHMSELRESETAAAATTPHVSELRESETAARMEAAAAHERIALLTAQERERELLSAHEAAEAKAQAAEERAADLANRIAQMEEMEAAAKEAAAVALERMQALAEQVKELSEKERAASARMGEMETRLEEASEKAAADHDLMVKLEDRAERAEKEARKAQEALGAANERVKFFFRVMRGLRDRERAAKEAMHAATDRLEAAVTEAENLRRKDELMREAWAVASERIELLTRQVQQVEGLKMEVKREAVDAAKVFLHESDEHRLMAAREELSAAEERERMLQAQLERLGAELAAARDDMAERDARLAAVAAEVAERERVVEESRAAIGAAEKRIKELEEQVGVAEERERKAKREAEEAEAVLAAALAAAETKDRENTLMETPQKTAAAAAAGAVSAVAAAGGASSAAGAAASGAADQLIARLQSQVAAMSSELEGARNAAAAASERSAFLMRQVARLKGTAAADAVSRSQGGSGGGKGEGSSSKHRVAALEVEIRALEKRERAARAEAEAEKARVRELAAQVGQLESKERAAREKLQSSQDRVGFFLRQAVELREREGASKSALKETFKKVEGLSHQVGLLQGELVRASKESGKSTDAVERLQLLTMELKEKIHETSRVASSIKKVPGSSKVNGFERSGAGLGVLKAPELTASNAAAAASNASSNGAASAAASKGVITGKGKEKEKKDDDNDDFPGGSGSGGGGVGGRGVSAQGKASSSGSRAGSPSFGALSQASSLRASRQTALASVAASHWPFQSLPVYAAPVSASSGHKRKGGKEKDGKGGEEPGWWSDQSQSLKADDASPAALSPSSPTSPLDSFRKALTTLALPIPFHQLGLRKRGSADLVAGEPAPEGPSPGNAEGSGRREGGEWGWVAAAALSQSVHSSTEMAVDPRTEAPLASTLHASPPSSALPRPRTGLDFLTGGGFTPTPVPAAAVAPSACQNEKLDSAEQPYPFAEMDAEPLIPFSPEDGGERRGSENAGPKILSLEELQLKAKQQWSHHFPWLIIGDTAEGRPCMRCKICMVYADPESQYGARGEGGIDIQKQTMRKHQWSIRHREAKDRLEQREAPQKRLASIFGDKSMVSSSWSKRWEALAAKDAAEEFPEFNVVDKVVRSFADILGRSIVQHARFKKLQEVITETNLEMQGIKDVRWLSRGDDIQRFADVLPAAVVLLHEYDKTTYTLVTSLKFQFFLFFLVDMLQELNSDDR